MKVGDTHFRTIRLHPNDPEIVQIINQQFLPHSFVMENLHTLREVCHAIKDMHVRGAGLIGAAAAWGMYLAMRTADRKGLCGDECLRYLQQAGDYLYATRPTARNLGWAVERCLKAISVVSKTEDRLKTIRQCAQAVSDEDAQNCRTIGLHGFRLIQEIFARKKDTVNILTHCNAGWLAFVDYGTATAPMYVAQEKEVPIHVWVDETRPRNQGASLTSWELGQQGIDHHIIVDNAGGHLMQHGLVDIVIVGSDRTTRTGDVANKIGTYLKALAARDNNIPFYVALPSATIDWTMRDGVNEIPIEERDQDEVRYAVGQLVLNEGPSDNDTEAPGTPLVNRVLLCPLDSKAKNFSFDVTPARLVTGLITERGVCRAAEADLLRLFPEFS